MIRSSFSPVAEHLTLSLDQVIGTLRRLNVEDFWCAGNMLTKLQKNWISPFTLKEKRHGRYSDAFILWINIEGKTTAIKIHEDCFENCKRIYDVPDILNGLVWSNDIPAIIKTLCVHGYRIVIYSWQDGKAPLQFLDENKWWGAEQLARLMTERIDSLLVKNHWLRGIWDPFNYPEQDEFLCTTNGLIVLDCNQIAPTQRLPFRSHNLATRIIQVWMDRKQQK